MSTIAEKIRILRERIAETCAKLSRNPAEVAIVAVTKTVPPQRIQEAVDAGIQILGENRVQEALSKVGSVKGDITWHMVGHLQRNKVKKALDIFDLIQSVDSYDLAREIDCHSRQRNRRTDILIEVNTSGEPTKFGIRPDEALDLVSKLVEMPNINVVGLMTIGAFTDDEGTVRKCFSTLREISETIRSSFKNLDLRWLSMGMSADYIWAIQEGSNMVRIGTAIFGER
ncbi:MAG: YggS family pyridoxal phosphate-dependent enzyme [bacterium]